MRVPLRRAERLVAAGIALQLLVAVPATALIGSGSATARGTTTRGDVVRADDERTRAVEELLARRSAAVLQRDKAAFLADLDPTQTRFVQRQSVVFDRLAAVPLESWSYAVDPERYRAHSPAVDAARGDWWSPDVLLRFSIAGYDAVPTEEPQGLTFVQRDDRWYLAADGDFAKTGHPSQKNIWDVGPVRVTKGRSCIALAHPSGASMAALALRECEAAAPRVTAFWGTGWLRKVVLVVPDTAAELQTLVPDIGDVSNIAAVATAELVDPDTGYHPVGDRVIVNPQSFRRLGPVGRRIVLTHEVTHVASRAATGPYVPTWFVEGIADYAGFLDAGVPLDLAAQELADLVKAGKAPTELPLDSEFQGGRDDLAATYEMSWLAVSLLIRTHGLAKVLELYRDIGAGSSAGILEVAFSEDLGQTVGEFTKTWSADVVRRLR